MRRKALALAIVTLCSLTLSAALAGPAAADVLVMTDGSRLEIDGEWVEKGRMIEFVLPNGTFGAVRASEVDLEASREATRAAAEPEEEEPEPETKPEPVLVLTDDDVPTAPRDVIAASQAGVTARAIQVVDWAIEPGNTPDEVRVVEGTLANRGSNPVRDVSLTVTVIGETPAGDDASLVRQARLESTTLEPGATTEFELVIRRTDVNSIGGPGVLENADASFEVSFQRQEPAEEEGEGEAEADS